MGFVAFMLSLFFGYVVFKPIFSSIGDTYVFGYTIFFLLQIYLVWVAIHGLLNQLSEVLLRIESMHSLHIDLNSSYIAWTGEPTV